jgi:hypothetical protein
MPAAGLTRLVPLAGVMNSRRPAGDGEAVAPVALAAGAAEPPRQPAMSRHAAPPSAVAASPPRSQRDSLPFRTWPPPADGWPPASD